jgi:hypothetical protein
MFVMACLSASVALADRPQVSQPGVRPSLTTSGEWVWGAAQRLVPSGVVGPVKGSAPLGGGVANLVYEDASHCVHLFHYTDPLPAGYADQNVMCGVTNRSASVVTHDSYRYFGTADVFARQSSDGHALNRSVTDFGFNGQGNFPFAGVSDLSYGLTGSLPLEVAPVAVVRPTTGELDVVSTYPSTSDLCSSPGNRAWTFELRNISGDPGLWEQVQSGGTWVPRWDPTSNNRQVPIDAAGGRGDREGYDIVGVGDNLGCYNPGTDMWGHPLTHQVWFHEVMCDCYIESGVELGPGDGQNPGDSGSWSTFGVAPVSPGSSTYSKVALFEAYNLPGQASRMDLAVRKSLGNVVCQQWLFHDVAKDNQVALYGDWLPGVGPGNTWVEGGGSTTIPWLCLGKSIENGVPGEAFRGSPSLTAACSPSWCSNDHIVVRTSNNSIVYKLVDGSNPTAPWTILGSAGANSGTRNDPLILSWGDDRLDVFWVDTAGALWHRAATLWSMNGPPQYKFCAGQNATCSNGAFPVSIAYGANGSFNYKMLPANQTIQCNNATFGDPLPGVAKACYTGPAGYRFCQTGDIGLNCAFSGYASVAYGANGRFNYHVFKNGVACSSGLFGFDPYPGKQKYCYIKQ